MAAPYRQIVESAQEGVYTVDTSWRITYANPSLGDMLGVPSAHLIGQSIFSFLAQPDRARALLRWRRPNYKRQPVELRLVRGDGSRFAAMVTATPFFDAQHRWVGTLGMVTDISEVRRLRKQVLDAEVAKKTFSRQVLHSLTRGRFHLVDYDELPLSGEVLATADLRDPVAFQKLRGRLTELARARGMSEERCGEFVLAVGEAAGNAVKHGGGGEAEIRSGERALAVRIQDHGPGIQAENLAATVLRPGFSTKVSLGMGYSLMLELVDAVWLATGPRGTCVQLEKSISAPVQEPLSELIDRFES